MLCRLARKLLFRQERKNENVWKEVPFPSKMKKEINKKQSVLEI